MPNDNNSTTNAFQAAAAPARDIANAELLQAAEEGSVAGIQRALERGADINARGGNEATALILAAAGDHAAAVTELLARKPDVALMNNFRQTALHCALREHARDDISLALIAAKTPLDGRDMHGNTAAFYTAQYAHPAVFAALVAAGADIALPGKNGVTPLMQSCALSHPEITDIAVKAPGCGLDKQDDSGMTALMTAINVKNLPSARTLIAAGGNIDLKNTAGETAEDIARRRDMPELAALLQKARTEKYEAFHAGVKSAPMKTVRFKPKTAGTPG